MLRPRPGIVLVVLCLTLQSAFAAAAAPSTPRVLWSWARRAPEVANFAAARGFATVYAHLPSADLESAETSTLLRRARERGVQILALDGHAAWVDEPRNLVRWVRSVRRNTDAAGVVLDVEPYLLDSWDGAGRAATMNRYLRMLERARHAAGDRTVIAAVPFWFDSDRYRRNGVTLLEQVLARVDGIAIMAYRDTLEGRDGVLALVERDLELAAAAGGSAVVSLQTARDDLDKLTFHEEGLARLRASVAELETRLIGRPGFGGVGVHHYEALRGLQR